MYEVKIIETNLELTARNRIALKDTSNAVKLEEVTRDSSMVLAPAGYAVLAVHNDKSDNGDYEQYIVVDTDGHKYVTGSSAFWSAFKGIFDEMSGEGEYEIEVFRKESKNYKGKYFLTCSIV